MSADPRDTLPMSVADMTFLVNKLGEDCGPLQYVRELTQNAVEGVCQLEQASGEVIWDVYWQHLDLDSAYKLCCIDTGVGMTGSDMVKYINQLSSSIHKQSLTGNFGVGAKIAAAPLNPHGIMYMSWKNGVGSMIHLWLDPEERVYGLKRWPKNNGEFWSYVSDDLKPDQILDHGTVVVLLGKSDEQNTMEAPVGTPMKSRWILRYLNTRYFKFPPNVTVRAREGWDNPRNDTRHNFLRIVEGQGPWLDKNCDVKGIVDLHLARAHWWILKDNVDKDSGHNTPGGHVAALHQNELYELVYGRAGIARLQTFGIIFGTSRVVIYVEPESGDERPVIANTARTHLIADGEPLDWAGWASEFRSKMPEELTLLQDQIGSQVNNTDHRKAISERLKQIKDLLRFARFRPSKDGGVSIDPATGLFGSPAKDGTYTMDGAKESGRKGGRSGDIYALFAESGPQMGTPVDSLPEPIAVWISEKDGTRVPPDLNDRAAKFLLDQNKLLINADFRVFSDMVDRWTETYHHVAGARATVEQVVREWFEQQLVEVVISAQSLKHTGKWSIEELCRLWNEEALTAAVLPRWHIDQNIRRSLGNRLGSLRAA